MDNLTPEDRNNLRDYIQTESGRKFLLLLVNQEMSLLAEAFNPKTPLERQGQIANRVSGIYWARTLIEDLIAPPKK